MEIVYKKNPRSKSVKISIQSAKKVLVSYPHWTPKFVARKFVEENKYWIEQRVQKIVQKSIHTETDDLVNIFGKSYRKLTQKDLNQPYGVYIDENIVYINVQSSSVLPQDLLDRFLKNTAQKYIIPRTHQLAEKMELSFKNITLRQQSSRWGSCSSKKNLNFNWRLVHYLPNIIDYVIIHELSHLVHMNHSKDFWNLVGAYDPEYRKHRGFLKRCGMSLG